MGVFIPAVNGLNVAMHFLDVNGDDQVNSFWVKRSIAWDAASINTMLGTFKTWFTTGDGTFTYQHKVAASVHLESVAGRDNTTQHSSSLIYQTGLPVAGLGGATAIEAGCSKAITHRTGLAGKSYRGRTFIVGVDATWVTSPQAGTIDASYMSDLLLAFNSLITTVTAADADATLVVCSRYYQPGGPKTPTVGRATALMTPITSFGFHDLNIDFQRRRAPGHGRRN